MSWLAFFGSRFISLFCFFVRDHYPNTVFVSSVPIVGFSLSYTYLKDHRRFPGNENAVLFEYQFSSDQCTTSEPSVVCEKEYILTLLAPFSRHLIMHERHWERFPEILLDWNQATLPVPTSVLSSSVNRTNASSTIYNPLIMFPCRSFIPT